MTKQETRDSKKGKHMKEYQSRVIDERAELDEKIRRLNTFISNSNDIFNQLPEEERVRLIKQEKIMRQYSAILRDRISAFQ